MAGQEERTALGVFGANLRRLRLQRCLSQEDLADRAGLHRTYISSVERGHRNLALVSIIRLASALGLSPCEMLEGLNASDQ